jgi:hypothetical protein
MIRLAHLLLALLLGSFGAAALASPARCDLQGIRAIAPRDAVIDSVRAVTAPVAHCEILGHIMTRDPGPNRVSWALTLPERDFGGRYYFIGQGGGAGQIVTGSLETSSMAMMVPGALKLLINGFAVATTDTGHKAGMGSWDWGANDPVKRLDYAHRGAHVSAVATQAITRAFYGMTGKLHRYHLGCSGGGRMGMMAAVHHPEDYDGIVASTVAKSGGSLHFAVIAKHVVNDPAGWISPAKLAFIERKVDEKCAGPDGLVRDPYGCRFDVTALECKGADGENCLTRAEIATFRVITGRFKLGNTEDSDMPGFSISNPTGWSSFLLGMTRPTNKGRENPWAPNPAPSSYGIVQSIARGMYFDNPNYDVVNDLDLKDQRTLDLLTERHSGWSVTTPDLSAFKRAGGKLIMWAPMSENAVPPATEIEYMAAIRKHVPGADEFVRLYEVPGVLHCAGGPGPQDSPDRLLDAVVAWVEDGQRPDALIVNGGPPRPPMPIVPGGQPVLLAPPVARSTLICPHPQKAIFTGRPGAYPYDPSKWTCR